MSSSLSLKPILHHLQIQAFSLATQLFPKKAHQMGYSKEQLLSRLQELNIEFSQYEHPVVLTVEAQAKHVGNFPGALSKNLFLKDKKQRFYLVSALADTKVDLKVLALRLGVGKGGLRMAPEEALQEVLQVPLGSVTPFALVNESARNVALLLDQGLKNQACCFFHPLSNDMSISLTFRGLDMFLKSIGKDPSYIDLEATPSVGKDQPPDLAALVPPSGSIAPTDFPEKATSIKASSENNVCVENKPVEITANAVKPSNNVQISKDKKATITKPSSSFRDTEHFVEEILGKTSALVLAEITEETTKQHGGKLAAVVSDKIRKQLSLELKSLATIFKNTAYTEGFHAATNRQPKHM